MSLASQIRYLLLVLLRVCLSPVTEFSIVTQKYLPFLTISLAVLFGEASLIVSSVLSPLVSNNGSDVTEAGLVRLPSLSIALKSATVIIAKSQQIKDVVIIIIPIFIIIFVANLIINFEISKFFMLNLSFFDLYVSGIFDASVRVETHDAHLVALGAPPPP